MPDECKDQDQINIQEFLNEREKIRKVLGNIGGKKLNRFSKTFNVIFFILVLLAFSGVFFLKSIEHKIESIEIGVLLLSIKLAIFLYNEAKVTHFQFWMLSSLEMRLNNLNKNMETVKSDIVIIKKSIENIEEALKLKKQDKE